MTKEVVCQSKQATFFVSLPIAGETLDTCATSLAGVSKDLAHVLNVSPVNRLERQILCK